MRKEKQKDREKENIAVRKEKQKDRAKENIAVRKRETKRQGERIKGKKFKGHCGRDREKKTRMKETERKIKGESDSQKEIRQNET